MPLSDDSFFPPPSDDPHGVFRSACFPVPYYLNTRCPMAQISALHSTSLLARLIRWMQRMHTHAALPPQLALAVVRKGPTTVRNRTALLLAMVLCGASVMGQLAMTRSTFNAAFVDLTTGGGATIAAGAVGDDGSNAGTPIGFNFDYLGTGYTTFTVNVNGWLSFGTQTGSSWVNTNLYVAGTGPTVAPWWDDLFATALAPNPAGTVLYQTTGVPGSQVCTVQWNVSAFTSGTPRFLHFQVKLYEGTNVIEFIYGTPDGGTVTNASESASIGLRSNTGGSGQYLDAVTGSAFTSNGTLQSDRWPAYNFRFTPGAPTAIAVGTYDVGVGQTYRNLNEAVADMNHRGISGAVTLNLTDAQYDVTPANGGHFFPILLGPISGSSAGNTVTITKSGTAAIIQYGGALGSSGTIGNQASGTAITSANVDPIIGLVGADQVTLNNLDIRGNTGNNLSDHGIGLYNSSSTNGATFNTVQNVTVRMAKTNTGSRGFLTNVSTAPSTAAGANSNNVFKDFAITNVYAGIQMTGNASFPDVNNQITRTNCTTFNTIGDPATANDIGNGASATYGIQLTNQNGFTCTNNRVRNVTGSAIQTDGINIVTASGVCLLSNNIIRGIRNSSTTSTTTISGIRASNAATGPHDIRIFNNAISEITSAYTGTATTTRTLKGIFITGTATNTQFSIWQNSVSINGSGSPNLSSVCFENATVTGPSYALYNNIFANLTPAQVTARHYGVFSTSATVLGNTGSAAQNNDVYVPNDAGVSGFTALGSATTYTTVGDWQAAMAQATANLSIDPAFTDASADLHSGASGLNGAGLNIAAFVPTDLDCNPRTPDNDIGAYRIDACTGAVAGTILGTPSICDGVSNSLTLSGASAGLGISYQWKYGTTSGGPYSNSLGAALSQSTNALSTGTYYFIVEVTCSAGPTTVTTGEFTFQVKQVPTATAGSNSPVCVGQTLNLTGGTDVGTAFAWTGPNSFANSVQNPVVPSVTLNASGTYSFTATFDGCTSAPSTTSVTISPEPTIVATTASPNPTCFNGSSQLIVDAPGSLPFVRITEITFFRTGTGQTSPWPVTIPTGPDDYVELNNTSGLPADISGWTYADYPTGSSTANHSLTFPPGTVIPPNGFIVIGLATGTNDPANYYYAATGTSGLYSSGANACFLLKNGATIIDAVATNTATFNAGLGVTPADWSGAGAPAPGGNAGSRRTAAADSNTGADWVASSVTAQTIGSFNAGYFNPFNTTIASYLWTPNTFLSADNIANPLASGVNVASQAYTVTVTSDAGCQSQGNVTVTTSAPITAATITGNLAFCAGGSTTLTAVPTDGAGPYTYLWSPGGETTNSITVNAGGTHGCQVTDNCGGSVSTGNVSVVENPLPAVTVNPTSATYCTGNTAVALSATGASTYVWSPAAGLDATNTALVNASPGATTTYTVTGTDINSCVNTATSTVTFLGSAPTITSATATPAAVCTGANSQLNATATLGGYYTGVGATSFIDISATGTVVPSVPNALGDDSEHAITLPSFTFNGTPYTSALIGNNGAIVLGVSTGTITHINTALPTPAFGGAGPVGLAPWWDDLDVVSGTTQIYTEQVGALFIIQYHNEDHDALNPGANFITFQVQLDLISGAVHFVYQDVSYGNALYNAGISATVGIQWANSANGFLQYSTGTASLADGQVISFFPNSISYSWSPATFLNNATIADPPASNVTSATTYTVPATSTAGCASSGTVSVSLDNTDTDNDLTIDCIDGCPLDPLKIAPGQCGCGVADTDTDSDATADCNDGCPLDPLKTAPGICGCGVSDVDSDGDLTVDCNDGCPLDPLKTAPGLCGCGVVDVDLNNNSICDSQEAEPLVKLGIVETPSSQLELRLLPNGPFYDLVASTVTTVRWVTTPGVSITGGSAQLVDPNWANAVGPVNFVSTTTNGIYSYATFVTFGVDQLQNAGLSWAPNVEVPFFRVPYVNTTNACITFEVVNDAFQASSNREWFVSLNGLDRTDGYIAGKTSATGYPAATCQNTSLTLSGGAATLDPLAISSSFAGCSGVLLSASQSVFDCTDVGANTITLTANANGTITTCTATVTVISTLSASATAGVVECTGGTTTVTVSATGGDAPYLGTGTFTVPAGPYSYTVTDAGGCTSTVSGTVNFVLLDTDGDGLCDAEDNCPTVPGQIGSACTDGDPNTTGDVLDATCTCVGTPFVDVTVRAILEGPYVLALNLMRDSLRVKGMLPLGQPYAPVPFLHSGTETVLPGVLAISGNDAVVDWVLLEVRSNGSPTTILATRAALLQRDGDITDTDGTSAVRFLGLTAGTYHLAVRHRNHNGVMTASPIALSGATPLLDLSAPSTATYGTDARKPIGSIAALWAGNVVNDDRIKYTGSANDRDPILVAIGGSIPTATISAYLGVDVNLDGTVKYTGTGNDRDPILINIGGSVPTNSRLQQLP